MPTLKQDLRGSTISLPKPVGEWAVVKPLKAPREGNNLPVLGCEFGCPALEDYSEGKAGGQHGIVFPLRTFFRREAFSMIFFNVAIVVPLMIGQKRGSCESKAQGLKEKVAQERLFSYATPLPNSADTNPKIHWAPRLWQTCREYGSSPGSSCIAKPGEGDGGWYFTGGKGIFFIPVISGISNTKPISAPSSLSWTARFRKQNKTKTTHPVII